MGEGHSFSHPPGTEDFEAQLMYSVSALEREEENVIFDRCPVDLMAYLIAAEGDAAGVLLEWGEQVGRAMRSLDGVILVPVEVPDLVETGWAVDPTGDRARRSLPRGVLVPSSRTKWLLSAILIGTQLSLASCVSERSSSESAAIIAVRDMHGLIPREGEGISRRFLSSVWEGLDPPQAVPAAVVEASGLPARRLTRSELEDSTTLVLNLFRPAALGGDSLRVIAEWLIYEPGELFWGVDYHYTIHCNRTCEIGVRHGPGNLN